MGSLWVTFYDIVVVIFLVIIAVIMLSMECVTKRDDGTENVENR
jgi:cytochrome bd-type quinol oxidase subunit 1